MKRNGRKQVCQWALTLLAAEGIRMLPGAKVLAMPGLREQAGVLSFVPLKKDVEEVGTSLAGQGIAVRTGLHCAPFAHKSAGTLQNGCSLTRTQPSTLPSASRRKLPMP